jgi:hypothetical protein
LQLLQRGKNEKRYRVAVSVCLDGDHPDKRTQERRPREKRFAKFAGDNVPVKLELDPFMKQGLRSVAKALRYEADAIERVRAAWRELEKMGEFEEREDVEDRFGVEGVEHSGGRTARVYYECEMLISLLPQSPKRRETH